MAPYMLVCMAFAHRENSPVQTALDQVATQVLRHMFQLCLANITLHMADGLSKSTAPPLRGRRKLQFHSPSTSY